MPSLRSVPVRHSRALAAEGDVGPCYRLFERCEYSVLSFFYPEWRALLRRTWPRGPILIGQNQHGLPCVHLAEWRFLSLAQYGVELCLVPPSGKPSPDLWGTRRSGLSDSATDCTFPQSLFPRSQMPWISGTATKQL